MISPPAPPTHVRFATSDPVRARDFLDRTYGCRLRVDSWRDHASDLTVDLIATAQISSGHVRMSDDPVFQVDGQDDLVVTTVLAGSASYANADFDQRMGRGDVYAGNHPALHCICVNHDLRALAICLRPSLMSAAAAEVAIDAPGTWRVATIRPVPGSSGRWKAANRYVDDLLAHPEAGAAPLVIGPATRLLALTALAIFTVPTAAGPLAGRRDAHPRTLRRAVAYIDAHPDLDLALSDIAREAGVTPRAIQLAFRRHLDTTPTTYLRRVRLHHAHEQLLDADPGDGATVGRTATDWGFASPGRFAAQYRAVYGRPPSETLRS